MNSVSFVEGGCPRGVIVVPENSSPEVVETARDLSDILARMSGATLPVATESPDGPALILRVHDRDRSLPPLAYHVWLDGDRVFFSGGSDRGVINGVYAFLERELGCRWYVPGPLGEHIPRRETIAVSDLDLLDEPDFESITGFGRHPDEAIGSLWSRRNRLEGFPQHFHSHNWMRIVPPQLLEERPGMFALVGKKRNPRQFCTTQPDVLDMTVSAARQYLDDHPEMASFSLSPGDFRGFCRCGNCRALDAELGVDPFSPGGSMTDRLVFFFNRVAERVVQTHPDRRLAFYAYMNYTRPPEVVKPHPMLLPVLVHTPWDYCMHHPIDDPDCERNRRFAEAVIGWHELTPKLYLYDYWAHYNLCGHHGVVHNIKRDLPWLRRHGIVGFYGEMHPQRWTQPLNFYLPARIAWNVDTDVDAIVAEFYQHMFRPAASEIAAFAGMFEDAMACVPKDAERDRQLAFIDTMTPEFFDRARMLLQRAEQILQDAGIGPGERYAIGERIRRYRYGLRLSEQIALKRQSRSAGRLERVIHHLERFLAILDEIAAEPELADTIALPLARRMAEAELRGLAPYRGVWERAIPDTEQRLALLRKLDEGHTREVARALGYWNDWYLVGLWPNDEGNLLDTPYPPEHGVNLDETFTAWSGETGWRLHRSESPYGIVDLEQFFYPQDSEYTVAYAYATIHAHRDADVRLEVTCDDDIVLWVNDELIFAGGAITGNFDIHVDAHLRAGENRVLAKVLNKPHAFNFSLRIADDAGLPHGAVVWE